MKFITATLGVLCMACTSSATMASAAQIGKLLTCIDPLTNAGFIIHPFVVQNTYSKIEFISNGKIYSEEFAENHFKNFENNQFLANKPKIVIFELAVALVLDFTTHPYKLTHKESDSEKTLTCIDNSK